jgi:hypothetical protein
METIIESRRREAEAYGSDFHVIKCPNGHEVAAVEYPKGYSQCVVLTVRAACPECGAGVEGSL